MEIVDKKLSELTPYQNNPRNNTPAVEPVAASIREFGFKVPLVVDRDGTIVAGHTRYKAAQLLGLATVPCIIADDLTPEQIKAFRLADNKVGELADWVPELLADELGGICEIDMSEFGFDTDAFGDDVTEIVEDDVPEEVEARSQLGDLWLLGEHRVICGDSTDVDVIEKLMGGGAG